LLLSSSSTKKRKRKGWATLKDLTLSSWNKHPNRWTTSVWEESCLEFSWKCRELCSGGTEIQHQAFSVGIGQ
jgi:hypothetical protein